MIKAKYTVVLKTLIDNENTKQELDKAMSTYPLYEQKSNEEYIPVFIPTREQLNKKILDYYKYREIGFETVGRFLDELEIALNEIMPYYNQIFFSVDQDYDITYNVDYTRTHEGTRTGSEEQNGTSLSNGSSTSEASDSSTSVGEINNYNKKVNSQTPQSALNIPANGIDTMEYADEVTFNHDNGTTNNTTSGESSTSATSEVSGTSNNNASREESESYEERIKGNYGQVSMQSLIEHYRKIITNVEQRIINDRRIAELFMLIY